jgi:hypothetical protein
MWTHVISVSARVIKVCFPSIFRLGHPLRSRLRCSRHSNTFGRFEVSTIASVKMALTSYITIMEQHMLARFLHFNKMKLKHSWRLRRFYLRVPRTLTICASLIRFMIVIRTTRLSRVRSQLIALFSLYYSLRTFCHCSLAGL